MKSTLKALLFATVLVMLIIGSVLLQGCSLHKFLSSQEVEMLNVPVGDFTIPVQLPSELLLDKFSGVKCERCWNISLCVRIYHYNENNAGLEHVNVWITYRGSNPVAFAVTWVSRDNRGSVLDMKAWIYDKGVAPRLTTRDEVNRVIERFYHHQKGPEKGDTT